MMKYYHHPNYEAFWTTRIRWTWVYLFIRELKKNGILKFQKIIHVHIYYLCTYRCKNLRQNMTIRGLHRENKNKNLNLCK
jgi:hypothetical protein